MTRFLGKLAPKTNPLDDPSVLKLSKTSLLGATGAELPYLPAAKHWLDVLPAGTPPFWKNPLGNTKKGCCVLSESGHRINVAYALHGQAPPITEEIVLDLYDHLTGGQDTGLYMLPTLKYIAEYGMGGVRISRPVAVDWRDPETVALVAGVCGGVAIGVNFPRAAWGQDIWDVGGDETNDGGHAIAMLGWSALRNFVSWGELHDATAAWVLRYADEGYAYHVPGYPPPSGLSQEALERVFAALG